MTKKIIGLTGETGSGKDSFCDYVKKNYQKVFCFRFSEPLSEVLKIFFNSVKKEDQQWLGSILRDRFGNNILGEAIAKKIKNIEDGIIILNGVRAETESKMIKNMGGKIIYVTADSKLRWQRVQSRNEKADDNISYDKFLEMEKAATESFILEISKTADYKIENNDSKELFYQGIKRVIDLI
jgi:dephospho-CoA kinase